MEKREKTAKVVRWITFSVILLIVLSGFAAELLVKAYQSLMVAQNAASQGLPAAEAAKFVWRRILMLTGDEANAFWAFPIWVLKLMKSSSRDGSLFFYSLRWIPYLILFLLPVLAAALKKLKQIPLLIVAGFAFLEGAGLLITSMSVKQLRHYGPAAIPFFLEALLLILLCVALWTKCTPFSIVVGVLCVFFLAISPIITAHTGMQMITMNANQQLWQTIRMLFRWFPNAYVISIWPLFKGFALTCYALIAFTAPAGFLKPLKK